MTGYLLLGAVWYVLLLAYALHYARQNSGGTSALVDALIASPLVDGRLNRLADAVCGPRPEEVSGVEAR